MNTRPLLQFIFLICCCGAQGVEPVSDTQSLLEWKYFYEKYFGIDLTISDIRIPAYKEDYDRIIVVAKDLSYEDIILAMKKRFELLLVNAYVTNYYDHNILDRRNNNDSYAIRIRNKDYSGEIRYVATYVEKFTVANIKPSTINDITLMERLLFELKYFDETNNHLDIESFTVCGGSYYKKDSLALSPAVGWKTGKGAYYPPFLFISECYTAFTLDGLYSRNVLTLIREPEQTEPADKDEWFEFPYLPDFK